MTGTGAGEPWARPSSRLWRMRLAELAVAGVVALVAAVAAGWSDRPAGPVVGVIAVVGVVAAATTFVRNRWRSWGYQERDEDLLVRRGVMVRRLSVVPYGRMQFVEVTAGLVERLFGLSTVKLHTAAAGSDARIPGLDAAEAARLRDRLAALGEAKAAGL